MYVNVGEGSDPVLMIHGAGVSGWMWRPLRELLAPTVKAIVPDLPGHGRSAAEPYISHDAAVQGLTGVIERFAPQGAHVVGFSMGAQLAILLASELDHLVRGVVVVSAETKPAPFPGLTLALLSLAAPLARRRRFAAAQAHQFGIPAHLLDDYLHDSTATNRETLLSSVSENLRFTLPATWRHYQGAAAVLVGANERKLMHDSAGLTASALPGSTLRTVQGAAHDIPFSQPGIIASELHGQITGFTP
jgi:pimeloyl-ACP methyl ester carboxylesterase